MRSTFLVAIFCTVFVPHTLFGQTLEAPLKYDIHQFGHETGNFLTEPFNWQTNDWVNVSLVGVGTLFALMADQSVRTQALRDRSYYNWMTPGRVYGEIYSPIAFFGVFAAYSLIAKDIRARKIAYEVGQGSLYAAAIVFPLKILIGRSRAYVSDTDKSFAPLKLLSLSDDYNSFPSGHTTIAFVLSTVLSRNVSPLWAKIALYIPALWTASSRVYQNFHWTSDVFFGAALGYFVGKWVVDQHIQQPSPALISSTKGKHELPNALPYIPISFSIPF